MLLELSVMILFDPVRMYLPLHLGSWRQSTFIFPTVEHEVEIWGAASHKDFPSFPHVLLLILGKGEEEEGYIVSTPRRKAANKLVSLFSNSLYS